MPREHRVRINQRHGLLLRSLPYDFIDARVGAKSERVQIAGTAEISVSRGGLLQLQFETGLLVSEFGKAIVNFGRFPEVGQRLGETSRRLRVRSSGKQFLPLRQLF